MRNSSRSFASLIHPGVPEMKTEPAFAFVVDNDDRDRAEVIKLVTSQGICVVAFKSAAEYLTFSRPIMPACLIMEVELPDTNGLDFQKQIANEDHPPIIFVTSHGDIPSSVRAIKHGANDFLVKPLQELELIRAVRAALALDRASRSERAERAGLQRRLSTLTPREREVLPLVVSGLLNKQAAAELGISEITYQIHRSNVMHKMHASSLADLVRMAGKLQIPVRHSRFRTPSQVDSSSRQLAYLDR